MSCELILADARNWLKRQKDGSVPNFLTGICDLNEIEDTLGSKKDKMKNYLKFFEQVSNLIFKKIDPNGYAIFVQTDRKYNKEWFDKSFMLTELAYKNGLKLVWHKIVLHQRVESTDLFRPTYAHMLCYTRNGTSGAAFPDVIDYSKRLYKNATPIAAVERAIEFIKRYNKKNPTVVDPFVGQGTTCLVAKKHGINSIGIDIDKNQIAKTKKKLKL